MQFLTSSAFDQPFEAFADQEMPAGIAYVNLGSPLSAHTNWSVEAAAAQGAVSSWFLGGTYATVIADSHGVDVRSSYSRQRYDGGNAAALAAFADGSRNVGGVQVMDRWTLQPARAGHLRRPLRALRLPAQPGALQPHDHGVAVARGSHLGARHRGAADDARPAPRNSCRRRTAAWRCRRSARSRRSSPARRFGRERTRHVGLALERDVASFLFGVRHFRQHVDDQLVTVFGLETPDGRTRADLGHYSVANGGNFSAAGWGFSVSRPMGSRVRGSVEYSIADADWTSVGDVDAIGRWAPSAVRALNERLHDVTTHLDAEIPETSTRVLATYKLNSGYTRDQLDEIDAGAGDAVRRAGLPGPAVPRRSRKANWELVFAVRNLFRESRDGAVSVYDELLVVRPPKRVVGGVTVQF